ncbi:hypothetical protein ENUP19_0082G0092 [Entamoeba nuttalli]|uniref:Condensin complex subunit 2 n=2 Tax=Entamoeba nuttalli TaxID=412467 RepID=K2GGN1_ENTNP|nr:hypothetical protein ENU1_039410 [Entamoeba nuttalli P19]EKE41926.1 hypothetical protein ENU1_039410 [Entamoeba nuttalli P19]|eukprot:XP_008855727.1 hypothetical protein ENU1_039410 [Entamoeba nuttalli P19]
MDKKRVSLGPNVRQSISLLEKSTMNEESLIQPVSRKSSFALPAPRQSIRRSIVPPRQHLSDEEIKKMYAECYLLCDQRKVNEKNVWALSLIDYMKDVIQVEALENQGTANFAKAGLAIDAGVQIYSVRVDAVHKKTFAVVDTIKQAEAVEEDLSSFDETPEKPEDDATQSSQQTQKKGRTKKTRTNIQKITIEKHPNTLLSKSDKVEFHKDRLFHQRISALEGKSILEDVVHNYGDFISGDYAEVIDIEEEDGDFEDPEIDWKGNNASQLNITELNTQDKNNLISTIIDDLKTPNATQQAILERQETADKLLEDLPNDEPMPYIDDVNPVDDQGGEILPTQEPDRSGNPDLLAPIVSRSGFTYFDPNLYNIKEIQKRIRVDAKIGKFIKPKVEKKQREKKEVQTMFDLRGMKTEPFKKLFSKKATTKEVRLFEKMKHTFNEIDINEFSRLMLVPLKRLSSGDEKVIEVVEEEKRESLLQSRASVLNGNRATLNGMRQSVIGQGKSILKGEEEDEEDERMFMRSEDEEEEKKKEESVIEKNQGFTSVAIPRMINMEKIIAATRPKNLDYDGAEKAIISVLKKWKESGKGDIIDFQSILDGIVEEIGNEKKKDLTVHFVFVSLNILCFRTSYKIIKKGENDIYLDMSK